MNALISGRARVAVISDSDRLICLHADDPTRPVEGSAQDLRRLEDARDVRVLHDTALPAVRAALDTAAGGELAIQLLLIGMDADMPPDLRAEAAEELTPLLERASVADAARGVLYAVPLPAACDAAGLLAICQAAGRRQVRAFVAGLLAVQPAVAEIDRAWQAVGETHFAPGDRAYARAAAVKDGLFRDATVCLRNRGNFETVLAAGLTAAHFRRVKNFRPVLGEWLAPFRRPAAASDADWSADNPAYDETPDARPAHRGRRSIDVEKVQDTVETQKDAVCRAMQHGDLHRARQYVRDLVEYQLQYDRGNHVFVVKSLCALANAAQELEFYDLQLDLTDQAIELLPDDAWSWAQHAQSLLNCRQFDAAIDAYGQTAYYGNFEDRVVAETGSGTVFLRMGRFADALGRFENALRLDPDNEYAHNGRAEAYCRLGRTSDAIGLYETLADDVTRPVSRGGYARALRDAGRLEESLAVYDRVIADFPDEVVPQCGRAETLRDMGRLDDALAAYETAVDRHRGEVTPKCGRAETLRQMGRLDDALSAYDQAIAAHPHAQVPRNGRAATLRDMGRLDDALRAYDEAIEKSPRSTFAANGRAETLRDMGRTEDALAAYRQIIDNDGNDWVARHGYGEILRETGRLDEAVAVFDAILTTQPANRFAGNSLAIVWAQLGRVQDAIASLTTTPVSQGDWIAFHIRAMLLLRSGDTSGAVAALKYGMQRGSTAAIRSAFRSALVVARLHQEDYATAGTLLDKEAVSASKPQTLLLRVHAAGAAGDRAAARDAFDRLPASGPYAFVRLRDALRLRYIDWHDGVTNDRQLVDREIDYLMAIRARAA